MKATQAAPFTSSASGSKLAAPAARRPMAKRSALRVHAVAEPVERISLPSRPKVRCCR